MVEKNIGQGHVCITFSDAIKHIKKHGWADLSTSGSDTWNNKIAEKLSIHLKTKVLCREKSPSYNGEGVYRFVVEVKTNREAKGLLSQEY